MGFDWFHLVLIYILTNATSKLIQKYALGDEKVDPTAFSAFFMFMVGAFTIPFLPFEKIVFPHSPKIWLAVLLSGVFYTVCMILYFHALKNTEVSQVETISTTRSIWLMVLGVIFFREDLSLAKFIGVALIFLGLAVIYWSKGSFTELKKPHLYTLLYAFLISNAYALDKFALGYFSICLYQVVIYIIPAIITVVFIPGTAGKIKYLLRPQKNNYLILLSCVIQMVSTLALYGAYQVGELSVVGPIAQTSTVLTITFGMLMLREKWNLKRKIAGIIITLIGVVFLKIISF